MRRERGFSLMEVLVALMVLGVVITTSMAAFLERNKRLRQASQTIVAYQALANEAEYWRRRPWAALETAPKEFESDTTMLAALKPFEATVVVSPVTQPGVRNVTLRIRWDEGRHEAALEVVRADTGGETLW